MFFVIYTIFKNFNFAITNCKIFNQFPKYSTDCKIINLRIFMENLEYNGDNDEG